MVKKRERMKSPAPVSDLMATLFRGKPAEKRLEEGKIWLVWDAAVGPQIAVKARPASFRDGVLTISVVSAPWMQQLTFLKKTILEKLNERLGRELVRDIYLKAGMPQPLPPRRQPARTTVRRLTEQESCRIGEETAAITDPELREAFVRVLTRALETATK